ncbi:MAG: DSF synthase [Parasphingorhabdus sp.]|jgi:DSF synthase
MLVAKQDSGLSPSVSRVREDKTVHRIKTAVSRDEKSQWKYFQSFFDESIKTHWWRLKSDCPAKFTPEVISELRTFQTDYANRMQVNVNNCKNSVPEYQVLTSDIPGIFNLGGDLSYFHDLITSGDRKALADYAHSCVDLVYHNSTALGFPTTTIALVKGNAMGGGMEAALSAQIIVAERQVTMGLPEVLFNLFPGMGAYHFLRRRMSECQAEKFILSGRMYSAEELHDLGIVDILAEPGEGENAVVRYIRKQRHQQKAIGGLRRVIRATDQVSRQTLIDAVDVWIDTAMDLDEPDLNKMRYLIRSQKNRGY